MINFRDVFPAYKIPSHFEDAEALKSLGCSRALIEGLYPEWSKGQVLCRPEDWFWLDPGWYNIDRKAPWLEEVYSIAGGCFARLPLKEQCELLGLQIIEVSAEKEPGSSRSWLGPSGAILTPEEAALEAVLGAGEVGFAKEGRLIDIIGYLAMKEADRERGRAYALDNDASVLDAERVAALKRALIKVLDDPPRLFDLAKPSVELVYRQRPVDRSTFLGLLARYERSIVLGMFDIFWEYRGSGGGHVDLTVFGDSTRYYEVKTTDKLRGSQARWIRNIARPLGLDVAVVHLIPC